MLTLKNEFITANFKTMGGELTSLVCNDREYIWQRDPKFWKGACPLMFPICGGLKDNVCYIDGKEYSIEKHGYARFKEFEVYEQTENSITFIHKSDEETKKCYPFDYELKIKYTLDGKRLTVRNEVLNTGNDTMYFSIGSHEGYATPEGIDQYEIVLPQKEELYSYAVEGNLLGENKTLILNNENVLPLDYKYFEVDALIFKDIISRSVILRKRDNSVKIRVEFDGFFNMMLWTVKDAGYICIEPWNGIPDRTYTDQNFKTKEGIQQVAAGQTYVRTHSIEIL